LGVRGSRADDPSCRLQYDNQQGRDRKSAKEKSDAAVVDALSAIQLCAAQLASAMNSLTLCIRGIKPAGCAS
jgi:hypothetical protein